ncbi:MAG: helix-turn-helix domain-containing protein [Gemmataceae bacterium]
MSSMTTEATPPTWLTVRQAVEYGRISRSSLYRLLSQGLLAARRPHGVRRTLIRRDDLDRVLMGSE